MNYSSSGGNKIYQGAKEETSAGTVAQVSGTRDIKVPERK
jgi:hypothetical protein